MAALFRCGAVVDFYNGSGYPLIPFYFTDVFLIDALGFVCPFYIYITVFLLIFKMYSIF